MCKKVDGVTIGGTTVLLSEPEGARPWRVDRLHWPFFHLGGTPTLSLSIESLSVFRPRGEICFDSGAAWHVKETPDEFSVASQGEEPARSGRVRQALRVDRTWRAGTLYLPTVRKGCGPRPFPLDYPLEQWLFVSLLARSSGAVVHGTGVILGGRGVVFAGTHGAGKSTLAALLRGRRGVRLLNDDRVVLRLVDGVWRLFGTPWAGTVRQVSPESAPLGGMFFIRHGPATCTLPLSPSQATPRLLARCYHPYWDREGLEALLGTIGRLAREVPCHDFPFVPRLQPVLESLENLENS